MSVQASEKEREVDSNRVKHAAQPLLHFQDPGTEVVIESGGAKGDTAPVHPMHAVEHEVTEKRASRVCTVGVNAFSPGQSKSFRCW